MTAPAHTRHADERGQALLPALLFLAVGCAALLLAFGSLQLTSAKIQLQNTADASAYAAALLQARDYNFSAYTNRAMIANQAAVAQMVGLKSFVDMLDEHVAENSLADRVASQVSRNGVDEWIRKKREARALIHPVRERLDVDLPRMTRSLDTIISALSDAQRSYHEATLMGVPSLAGQVARANQPDTRLADGAFDDPQSQQELSAWRDHSVEFKPLERPTDRFAEAVTAASTLGGFTTRRWIKEEETVIGDGCWGAVSRKADLIGGTQLRPRREGWQAIDGTSTRVQTRHDCATTKVIQVWVEDEDDDDGGEAGADGDGGAKGHWELREVREIEPSVDDTSEEGRGGAGNGRKSRYQSWYGYGGYVNYGYPSPSPGTVMPSMRAQYRAGSGVSMSVDGGLQPYRDLAGQGPDQIAPRITVRLVRDQGSTISDQRLLGEGRVGVSMSGPPLTALASGQAYFARPDEKGLRYVYGLLRYSGGWSRADGRTEYPSLFNPYWEARLAPVPDAMRASASDASSRGEAR
ncbi:hypothetical protein [Burkholderia gladioli]|jgi:hypothetical protein|uniref:hypothetical protein n=1 Tax=Burkholderia gladioli TaxID=28095 RepID=UPI0016403018|nr:hypothetical protein [Burkholderia gladioli]